jgi:hypothetical protein
MTFGGAHSLRVSVRSSSPAIADPSQEVRPTREPTREAHRALRVRFMAPELTGGAG